MSDKTFLLPPNTEKFFADVATRSAATSMSELRDSGMGYMADRLDAALKALSEKA